MVLVNAPKFRIGLVQMTCSPDPAENLEKAVSKVKEAAAQGAQVVCLQELFRSQYFCREEDARLFDLAESIPGPSTEVLSRVARESNVAIVASLFEKRAEGLYHNTAAIIDADGAYLGKYRKMHIPDDPLFYEKFYFTPGDLGFKTWNTRYGKIGVLICWDQWYPEAARVMALQGADLLLYPTAIGSEVGSQADNDTADMWRRAMDGHAVCNHVPLAAANRFGVEDELTFYGSSFIVDHRGRPLADASRSEATTLYAELDFAQATADRAGWGLFRDRRPDLYGDIARS